MLKWETSREDYCTIRKIVDRVVKEKIMTRNRIDVEMDIIAAHLNGCPLDLGKLLEVDTFSFAHDIQGIQDHLDRTTGEMKDCFLPRCAAHKGEGDE